MSNYVDINTLSEMDALLVSDLSVSTASSLFPSDTRKAALNRAYRKAGGLFRWPALEDAQKTSSGVSQEYYDANQTWKPDSVWRVEVDGVPYGETPDGSPMRFEDYLDWKVNNPTSLDKKWAVQWLRVFIFPISTTVGNNNIVMWGQKNITPMSLNSDTTIFSYNSPECNEAIVLEAAAILKKKGDSLQASQFMSAEAKSVLTINYNKIRQEQQKYEKTQPFFVVPDFYARFGHHTRNNNIGDFTRN